MFNTPTQGVELFQFSRGKGLCGQVGDKGFKGIFSNRETDDPKRQLIKHSREMIFAFLRKIIKGMAVGNIFIVIALFAKLLDFVGLLAG